ncbi:hypothetical protein L3D22_10985 [Lysobacter soli]|uniref:VgrG-related protein n=1 Tax=Lysobacter soli TaxID=453783 RepID=UPI0020A000E1|nr:hypothetical protein [Lysobacter soli]UTA52912.1 hypothetical protein L3D22_10985 [Lysobacter soli]
MAYRTNREYLDATKGTPGDGPTLRPYSTGFVLVRHRLQAPTPPQPDKPAPMDHPMADARNMGTYLYSDPEGRQRARWLRHGTPLTVEIGKYSPGQRYLRVLGIGGPGSPATGWISPTWLALDPAAGTSLFNVLGFKDQVSTYVRGGDHPDPERMAAYSQNQAERARPAPAPAPTLTLYSLYMHLADFADYRAQSKWQRPGWWSAPQYRVGDKAKDQQAAASVHAKASRSVGLNIREEPSGKSVILGLLPRGTCIETGERSSNGKWARISKVVAGEIDSPVAGSHVPVGALNGWVYLGELMADTRPEAFDSVVVLDKPFPIRQGDVLGYLGEDVPSRANPIANQPVSRRLLHLEVFSGDDVPAYLAASRQWAGATLGDKERTLLRLRPGDTLHTEPNGAVACTLNWAQLLPLSTLESKEVDGQRWRKVKGLMLGNGRMGEGWAKEAGHLASPWEWPGFDVVDEHASSSGGIFEDAAAWAGFIRKKGPRPEETPFYKQLRRMLDTNHDGLVSEQELDAALRDRSKAAHMARIIVRHDSAWAKEPAARQRNVMARIAELLGPGAVEQVGAEAPRAGNLPWWDEVAAGVDGFAEEPRVYHFHPGGLAGCFVAVGSRKRRDHDLGALSATYETGGRGSATVSGGHGDAGGASYGAYQMTSKPNGGTVRRFLNSEDFFVARRLRWADPRRPRFHCAVETDGAGAPVGVRGR